MRRVLKKPLCLVLTLLLLWACVPVVRAAEYKVSSTALHLGENAVATDRTVLTTLYVFKPATVGAYSVSVEDPAAILSYWHGSKFYVTGLAEEAVDGSLVVECSSAGQSFLIGLGGVDTSVITITEVEGYVPPEEVIFEHYVNRHTPVSDFAMPSDELTRVDVTKPQTLVADDDGIYHLGGINGPVLYVNMRAATYADLYACYHPTSGTGALYMHGVYVDDAGKKRGYEFIDAMRPYAEALDSDGYYYLTVDLATYIQTYGKNQGWFRKDSSPFTLIKQGKFIEESAWLINAYYVAPAIVRGDANGDGKVNNRDLGVLQQHLSDWSVNIYRAACDIDGNGSVTNRDLGLLQQVLSEG